MTSDTTYHRPVLFGEVIKGLDIKANGVYFDGTLGGGSHSYGILSTDRTVRLVGTDRDAEAIAQSTEHLKRFEGRFQLYKSDYRNYKEVLSLAGVEKLDGVLIDLGVSSHQIDDAKRGFSYRIPSAPLDMRMDTDSSFNAQVVVNEYPLERLTHIIKEYGEEKFAPYIAKNIVRAREREKITTCGQLALIVQESLPAKLRTPACARQTFQAIRIEVNNELTGLRECIKGLIKRLKKDGRICIITFHSLEDRIVKQSFQEMASECNCPKFFPVCVCGKQREIEILTKKPITASQQELETNSRSKSAKLRIAKKL